MAYCGRVLFLNFPQWNQPSIDFYEKRLQAIPMSEWVGMRLEGEGINRLLKLVDA